MRYKAYDKTGKILETGIAINKTQLRLSLIKSENIHEIDTVEYNNRTYKMSDIYKI